MSILNNDGNSKSQPVIRHPHGNKITLRIRLTEKQVTVTDGVVDTIDEECIPHGAVTVRFSMGKRAIDRVATVQGDTIIVTDNGSIPPGTYSIEILFEDSAGQPMRYKKKTVLHVADDTEGGGQYENDEMNVQATYPVVNGVTPAITVGDVDVIISENGKYKGDDTPDDNYADVTAQYGESSIEVGDDEVIINL